jgi:3'(2'), 5'-bisphosphate nucleotidase
MPGTRWSFPPGVLIVCLRITGTPIQGQGDSHISSRLGQGSCCNAQRRTSLSGSEAGRAGRHRQAFQSSGDPFDVNSRLFLPSPEIRTDLPERQDGCHRAGPPECRLVVTTSQRDRIMELKQLTDALGAHAPDIVRWSGAIAKQLRKFNIALEGKSSGSSNTDALTLADLTVQELVVAALRDRAPILRHCRIEAEEANGDLAAFAAESPYVLALDPIDGTKYYRDRTGSGWAVLLHLRTRETVHYSLCFAPEAGPNGMWMEAVGDRLVCGPDQLDRPARQVLDDLPPVDLKRSVTSRNIYLIGFQKRDVERAGQVTGLGLTGVAPDDMPGSIYPLLASGEFAGSLIHSPNIYDFPLSLQIARMLGGDSVWVHNGQPVHFDELWMDTRADMLRLPGIVATSPDRTILKQLCDLARDWPKERYID